MRADVLPTKCTDCQGRGFTEHITDALPWPAAKLCATCEGFGTVGEQHKPRDFDLPTVRWSESINNAVNMYGPSGMLEVRLIRGKLKIGHYRTMQDKSDRVYWTPLARIVPLESER